MEVEKQLDALITFHKEYKHGEIYSHKENPYGTIQLGDRDNTKKNNAIKKLIDNYELIAQNDLIQELYEQIRRDEYISPDNIFNFRITVKGLMFEGYEKTKKSKKSKEKIELRKSNILFVGSVIAGCYALLKIGELICQFICSK